MKIHEYVPGYFDRDIITQKTRRMMDNKPRRCGCDGRSVEENNQIIGLSAPRTCCGIPSEMLHTDSERSR
jgi:hypothetical protein